MARHPVTFSKPIHQTHGSAFGWARQYIGQYSQLGLGAREWQQLPGIARFRICASCSPAPLEPQLPCRTQQAERPLLQLDISSFGRTRYAIRASFTCGFILLVVHWGRAVALCPPPAGAAGSVAGSSRRCCMGCWSKGREGGRSAKRPKWREGARTGKRVGAPLQAHTRPADENSGRAGKREKGRGGREREESVRAAAAPARRRGVCGYNWRQG